MDRLKVIQWTTGKVGKLALRGIMDDPRLQLVGVYAWSDNKVGADAGSLCGRPDCGVKATNVMEELLALGADSVIYTPFMADLEQVETLLENGLDVISTNLFLNCGGVQGETRDRLTAACTRGNSSLFVTGVNPGWINSMIAAMTAVCRKVDSVFVAESADCSVYESAETWQAMGMGLAEATPELMATARSWLMSFYDAVQRIAEALELELDDMQFFADYATTSETVDLGWFCMQKGSFGAVRAGWKGMARGRPMVTLQVTWYLTKLLNEGWEFDDDHYHVVIEGEPGLDSRMRFVAPEHWGNHEWDTMTAMPAVNAVYNVKRAPAGILSLAEAGLVAAPAGLWPE